MTAMTRAMIIISTTNVDATDAGATDASATDAGATDASATDAGATDASATDAGATDAGATDAGATDACEAMDISTYEDAYAHTHTHTHTHAYIPARSTVFFEVKDCTNVFTKSEIEELINNKHITIDQAIKRDTSGQFVIVAPTTTCKCSIKERILTQRNTHCKNCNKHLPIPIKVIYEDFIKIENNILQVTVKTVKTTEDDQVVIFTHINKTLNEWIYHIPINIIFSVTVRNYSRSKVQLTPIYIYGETKENFDKFDILTFESYTLNPNLKIEKDDLENGWELYDEKGKLVLKLCFKVVYKQM
jgi:hypothetical protein